MSQGIKLNCVIVSQGREFRITTNHPVYRLRYTIMTRCYNAIKAVNNDYKYYQGRGIKVCDEWRNNPTFFYQWCFDNGWKESLVLDRIDQNGNYEPNNCQFITARKNLQKMHKDNKMTGERAGNAKLKEQQVMEIIKMLRDGIKHSEIGKIYSVSKSTITAINNGQNWKYLDLEV